MKIAGLLVIVFGWLIAVSSVLLTSTAIQFVVALAGFGLALVGIIAILNRAHMEHAIWRVDSGRP